MKDLQIAKKQTWDEKQRASGRFEEERKVNLANKVFYDLFLEVQPISSIGRALYLPVIIGLILGQNEKLSFTVDLGHCV